MIRVCAKVPTVALAAFFFFQASSAFAQFETRSQSGTNIVPLNAVTADFNRDGKMDVAVGSVGSDGHGAFPYEIQVFLGRGDGTFEPPQAYDIGSGTGPIAVADLNRDGFPDLVVVNGACPNDLCDNSVSVLIGKGDGSFEPPVNYSVPAGPAGVVLGDFNGDGKPDIATLSQSDHSTTCDCVGVLLGNGDGTFQEPAIVTSLAAYPFAMVSGHFDSDKNLDLAVTENEVSSGSVQVLLGNGDGTFRIGSSYTLAPEPMSIVAADLRNSHKTDLAIGEFEGMGVAVLLGNGDGTFEQPVVYQAGTPLGVAAADVNGDGIMDLVAATSNVSYGLTDVLDGKGDGTFKTAIGYRSGEFPRAVAIADFNGDRWPDIVTIDQVGDAAFVLLNTGVASLSPTTPLNFKTQKHGTTSEPQTVKLTNTGIAELKISSMRASSQFLMKSTCGSNVAPGASCAISVTFSPTSTGAKSGTVTINDSASSKPQVIELSGTGT